MQTFPVSEEPPPFLEISDYLKESLSGAFSADKGAPSQRGQPLPHHPPQTLQTRSHEPPGAGFPESSNGTGVILIHAPLKGASPWQRCPYEMNSSLYVHDSLIVDQ